MKETKTANKKRPWETSDIVREVPGKATSHSKRYVMGDGTEKEVFTFEPMHYYDEKKKQWFEIDNTLEEREDGYTASLGKYKAKVSRKDDNEAIEVKGEDGEGNISWEYLGTTDPRYNHARKPKKHRGGMRVRRSDDVDGAIGNSVTYENADGDVDIEYGLSASGVKENIIIKEKSKRYKYFFKLYVNGFKMQLSEDGKSVEFYKKSYEERKTPEFTMPAPFMYDATGEVCREVYYDFEPVTKDNEDEYLFTVTANEDWINSENRMFPITVDPQLIVRESENIITFYSEKTLKTNSTDSTGNSIVNVVQSDNIILSKEHNGNESVAYIGFKNKAYLSIAEIVSAKLVLNCKTSFANNTIMVNDNPISQSGTQLIMDVTEGLTKDQRYNLTTNSIGTFEFYSYGIYAPYVEITYTTDSLSNSHKRKLALVPCVDLIYNINTGYPSIEFEAIKDESMGVSISNVYIGKKGYASGFKMNIDEKFVKDQASGKYIWTDKFGKAHYFSERFYYFDYYGYKMEIEKTEYVRMDSEGRFWYDHYETVMDDEGNEKIKFVRTYEAFRELYSLEGYLATSRVQDIENAEWIEQREEKEREIEENLKNYSKALCEFVVVDTSLGKTIFTVEKPEDYKSAAASITDNSKLLLTKSDAVSYESMLKTLTEISHGKKRSNTQWENLVENGKIHLAELDLEAASLASSKVSLLMSRKDCEDVINECDSDDENDAATIEKMNQKIAHIGCLTDESDQEVNITINNVNNTIPTQFAIYKKQLDIHTRKQNLYPSDEADIAYYPTEEYNDVNTKNIIRQIYDVRYQIFDLEKQEEIVYTQMSILKSKSAEYLELGKQYYKDYIKLKAECEYIKLHTPVAFIFAEDTIKGYNKNGDLVSIINKGRSPVIIEREVFNEKGDIRVSAIKNQDGKAITYEYDCYSYLKSITASNGTKTLYSRYGNYIRRVEIGDKIYEFEYISEMLSKVSDGNISVSLEYTDEGQLNSITYSSLVEKLEHNNCKMSVSEISKISISYDYVITGANTYDIHPKITFKDEKTGNESIYIVGIGSGYSYYEIVNGYVSYAEKYSKGSYYREKTVADKKLLNRYTLDNFEIKGTKEFLKYNLGRLEARRIEFEDMKSDGTPYLKVNINEYTYDKQGKVISVSVTERDEYPVYDDTANPPIIVSSTEIETSRSTENYFYNSDGILVRKESYDVEEKEKCGVNIEEYIYDENSGVVKTCRYNSLDSSTKFYTEIVVDKNGIMIASVDQTGRAKTVYEYDAFGNLVSELLPNSSRYAYGRDINGKITSITHSSRDGEENSTQKLYTNGKLTGVRSGNNVTNYSYDAKGRLLSVDLNDTDGYVTYTYEGDNTDAEKTVATMKNGTVLTSTRNKLGNVIQSTRGDKTVDFEYDNENRVVKSDDSVSGEVEYTYDEEGNLTSVSSGDVAESYTYDEDNKCTSRTVTVDEKTKSFAFTYKDIKAKPLASISVDGITVNPELDVNGRNIGKIVSVSGSKIAEEQIAYLKFGDRATILPSTVRYGNNVNGKYVVRDSVKYRYDVMGNIVEVLENGLSVAKYEYDALGRLKREDNKHFAKTTLFSYDDNGNILTKYEYAFTNVDTDELNAVEPTRTVLYGYDEDSDRLLTIDDSSKDTVDVFEYDDIGNPTTYRGKSATWSCGREMTGFDGNTFAYDARGRRVSKNDITFTYDSNGKLIKQSNGLEFIYDHTGLLAVEYEGLRYFYRKNAQNDIIALLDSEGNVVVKYVYDAWGNCTTVVIDENAANIANLNPFRYRSYYLDTGFNLYYLKTRYYDPEICRFITIDDISYIASDTINGLNLYAYCGNNPVVKVDPNGTAWYNKLYDYVNTALGLLNPVSKITAIGAVAVAAVQGRWDDLKHDLNSGAFNPLNQDHGIALESKVFSFYKGESVVRHSIPKLSSLQIGGTIFLNISEVNDTYGEETINHEWGHGVQERVLGAGYLILVAIPSAYYCNFGDYLFESDVNKREKMYYSKVWERTADWLGGVDRHNYYDFWYKDNFIFW